MNHVEKKLGQMKNIGWVILIALLGLMGCSKDTTDTLSSDLTGTWEWVHTTGGIAGVNQTPASVGYTYRVTYTKEGHYLQYDKDGKLQYDYLYETSRSTSIMDNKEHNMLTLNASTTFSYEVRNDSLFLNQEAYDGFNVTFVRK